MDDEPNIELELLKDFYQHWEKFHQTARSTLPKSSKELAAQRMMDAAHTLRAFYNPPPLIAQLN